MPAAAFPGSRRLSWETLLDIPVGLAPPRPDGTGPAGRILPGGPALRYPGAHRLHPAGLAGPSRHRQMPDGGPSAALTSPPPVAFAFPGRQVHAAQISPQPDARTTSRSSRAPQILLPDHPEDPRPSPAGRLVLAGRVLLRSGDGYAITVLLSGTPAPRSPLVRQDAALASRNITTVTSPGSARRRTA